MRVGTEWLVDAHGCRPEALRDIAVVRALLERILSSLALSVVASGAGGTWHVFGGEGGVTGIYLLTESHLACHTYPEHRVATINLYSCNDRPEFPWAGELARTLGASHVSVQAIARGKAR